MLRVSTGNFRKLSLPSIISVVMIGLRAVVASDALSCLISLYCSLRYYTRVLSLSMLSISSIVLSLSLIPMLGKSMTKPPCMSSHTLGIRS